MTTTATADYALLKSYVLSYGLTNFNVILGAPIDRLKVAVQTSSLPAWQASRDVLQSGLRNTFTGLKISLIRQNLKPLHRTILITWLPKKIESLTDGHPNGALAATILKPVASCLVDNVITTPFEVIKIQQMENPEKGMARVIKDTFAAHGARGFFSGLSAGVYRSLLPWANLYITHHIASKQLEKRDKNMGIGYSVMTATASALPITLITNPLDVAKTRMQSKIKNEDGTKDGVFKTMRKVARNEGVLKLWRGSFFRMVHRTQNMSVGLIVMSYYSSHFRSSE